MTDTMMFIDVDGVLNAYDGRLSIPSWGWPQETARTSRVLGFGVVYSPDMISRLRAVADRPDVQAHWLTTWEAGDAVLDLAETLEIGSDWPIIYRAGYPEKPWWKLDAIQRTTAGFNGKIVWVDDDINYVPEAVEWCQRPNVLGVCPRTTTGITLRQMKLIETYLELGEIAS